MEKQAVIRPGTTPDTEKKLTPGTKVAGAENLVCKLDDDMAKRLADVAAKR